MLLFYCQYNLKSIRSKYNLLYYISLPNDHLFSSKT